MTDSIPPDKFMELFDRLSEHVRLGRVRSPQEIRGRIRHVLNLLKQGYKTAKRGSTIKKFKADYIHLRTLYRHHIEKRIWREAAENPDGLIDLTLDYGYDRAKRIVLEREKRRRGRLRRAG